MEIDSALSRPKSAPGEPYPEVNIYLRLLVVRSHHQLTLKSTYGKTMHLACDIVGKMQALSCGALILSPQKLRLLWDEGVSLLACCPMLDYKSLRPIHAFHFILT